MYVSPKLNKSEIKQFLKVIWNNNIHIHHQI